MKMYLVETSSVGYLQNSVTVMAVDANYSSHNSKWNF